MFAKIRNALKFLLLLDVVNQSFAAVVQFQKPLDSVKESFPPVVMIPGDGGSKLDARLNLKKASPDCPTKRDWFRIWLNILELEPKKLPCLSDALSLEFDPATNTSKLPDGVEIRVPEFGTAKSLEYIDEGWIAYCLGIGDYAHELVEALVLAGGTRNVTIRGAPYDFRFAMASQKTYFQRLEKLIEETYYANKLSKVALIGHSLGGLYTTWFLNRKSQAWKDKYILSFISVSTPWGGSIESLQSVISGFSFHHSTIIKPLVVRKEQRTFESVFMLLPNSKVWSKDEMFVLTDKKNYSMAEEDLTSMFNDIGVSNKLYNYIIRSNHQQDSPPLLPHPGVKTYCIYGVGVPTNHVLDYRGKKFPDENPDMMQVPGDGTAAYQSLSVCRGWNLGEKLIEVPSADHNSFLQKWSKVEYVLKALFDSK